jgi:HTH-type transcriptional regulator, sugar sensing transcriptional regulator
MQQKEEDLDVLNKLGLTILQAQTYLALTKMGKANAKTIATNSNIDRAHIYRVISSLEELKLVDKKLTVPTIYQALPLEDGIQMLLENKTEQMKNLSVLAGEIVKRNKKILKERAQEENCDFVIIPDNKTLYRKILEMNENCQTSLDMIINLRSTLKIRDAVVVLDNMKRNFKTVSKKGKKIRFLTYLNEGESPVKECDSLKEIDRLEQRYTFEKPSITLTLVDRREALLNTAVPTPEGKPSLWTKNPTVVHIFQDLFDQRWNNSKEIYPFKQG